jgi:enoyl-[acyl-carrier protein] reductase I
MLLKGKKGIIFGPLNDKSIAWKVAEECHKEGADFVLSNAPIAIRMGDINKLAKSCNSIVIPADISSVSDIENLLNETKNYFNSKIDFVLHSVGMSLNVRKKKHYTNLNYDFLFKGLDVSAISFHKILQTLYKNDFINEWGSVVALSYIAAQRTFPDYNDMADNKSFLESITRSFGYHFGKNKNVRINTISQSPTMTTAGSGVKGFDKFYKYAELLSPLGNASALNCAKFIVTLFSDYTKMLTMQNIYHDGGFSSTGVSNEIIEKI